MSFASSLTTRRLAGWLLFVSLAVHAPIAIAAFFYSKKPIADFDNFYEIGMKAGRPYVDFAVEFPIGTTEAFRTLAPIAGDRERFGFAIVALNVVADLAIVCALAWGWGLPAAACYALVVTPLLDLYLLRLDLWSTALATVGVAAWRRHRQVVTAIGLIAGAAFKLWPLAFVPLLFVYDVGWARRLAEGPAHRPAPTPDVRSDRSADGRAHRAAPTTDDTDRAAPTTDDIDGRAHRAAPAFGFAPVAVAAIAGLIVAVAWLWVAGARGLYQVLTFRGSRGFEVESTIGGLWMLVDRSSLRLEHGAWRIGEMIGPTSIVLFVLGGLPCVWMIWRGARTRHLGAGWAGGLSALLACSALLSPQYSAWFAPASGIAWAEGDRGIAVLTGLAVFLTNLEYKSFVPLLRGDGGAIALVLARNLLLVALAIVAARLLAKSAVRYGLKPISDGRGATG